MEDRFNFNAVVCGCYETDSCNFLDQEDIEIPIYLEGVDLYAGGDLIGTDRYKIEDAIKYQYPNLKQAYFSKIMEFFENNSYNSDNNYDYITIKPVKILQCTGIKDGNGILIYEKDVIADGNKRYLVKFWNGTFMLYDKDTLQCRNIKDLRISNCEVIGNFLNLYSRNLKTFLK